jgi:hypothetical protein
VVDLAASKVLPGLGKAGWTAGQLLGYEIALEGVRQAVGYYAQQIAEAEAAGEPEAAAIEALRAEQAAWAARGRDLGVLDVKAVAAIRNDADELLSVDDDEDEE